MQRSADPLSATLRNVLQFLTDLHASGKSFSTVNIHRSMLSKTLDPVDGVAVGVHPLVVRLMRGCYHQNPPQPKYSEIWDPSKVSEFIGTLGENRYLSLAVLANKLVTLIALATWMRVSEVTAISFQSIRFTEKGVTFSLDRLRKTQRCGAFKSFEMESIQDTKLCPVDTLREFMDRTEKFRSASNESSLFIALVKPHGPVSSNTVSRWIKSVFKKAGIDTSIFGAHSTRSAAASRAVTEGASVGAVLHAGSWAHEATFNRFYNRAPARMV